MKLGSEHPVTVLTHLYAELDQKIEGFASRAGLHCPEGCGQCCEIFVPEITRPEAELIADHLIGLGQTVTLESWVRGELPGACPFFKLEGSPYHCSIYSVRPLICRLFGYAGSRDKNGELRFRPCRHMPAKIPQKLEIEVAMEPYGLQVEGLVPGGTKAGIGDAVRDAVARLLLISRITGYDCAAPFTEERIG